MLEAINLSCIRPHQTLFTQLSFQLNQGEILLIAGSNGSGKSSLLRLLTGLSLPTAGEIHWQHIPIHPIRAEYSEALHYVGHTNGIKLGLTVVENLQLAAHLTGFVFSGKFESLLTQLQLNAHKNTPAKYLSTGQKRRLALAKLFLIPKRLWILDEPFTALDTETQLFFTSSLEAHLQQGGMAIISSHHPMNMTHAALQIVRLDR